AEGFTQELLVHGAWDSADGGVALRADGQLTEGEEAVGEVRVTPTPTGFFPALWEPRSEEHTSELQSQSNLVCRLLLEKKKFVLHRLRDRKQIGLVVLVVVVAEEQRHHAGRGRAHEGIGVANGSERGLEIGNIDGGRLAVAHRDRRVAGGRLSPRAAGITEHALLQAR